MGHLHVRDHRRKYKHVRQPGYGWRAGKATELSRYPYNSGYGSSSGGEEGFVHKGLRINDNQQQLRGTINRSGSGQWVLDCGTGEPNGAALLSRLSFASFRFLITSYHEFPFRIITLRSQQNSPFLENSSSRQGTLNNSHDIVSRTIPYTSTIMDFLPSIHPSTSPSRPPTLTTRNGDPLQLWETWHITWCKALLGDWCASALNYSS